MANDTITYDYPTIDRCLEMMEAKARQILGETTDMANDVKTIMVGWEGTTADAYQRLAGDLRADLEQNVDNLKTLNKELDAAAERMKLQDKKGGAGLGGS